MAEHIGSVYINVLPDAEGFWRDFQRRTRADADSTGRTIGRPLGSSMGDAAGVEARRRIELLLRNINADVNVNVRNGGLGAVRAEAGKSEKSVGLLRTAIELLGPALVPVAGGAAALGGGFAALGIAGLIAVQGINAEMKKGSKAGTDYAGIVSQLKGDWAGLQHTVAVGILPGLDQTISKLNGEMPEFNLVMGRSASILSDIATHGLAGIIGGFSTFEPVIVRVESIVEGLAQRFEAWATGPGGVKFADGLLTSLDHLVPALAQLAELATHLVAALQPVGNGSLDLLTQMTGLLNLLPVDVLKAATTAYVAFRAAVAVTAGLKAATTALEGFATAEGTAAAGASVAAAGSARLAGSMATLIGRLAPYAAAWVGATFATNAAASATDSYFGSLSDGEQFLYGFSHVLSDIFSFKWGSIVSDVTKSVDEANKLRGLTADFYQFTTKPVYTKLNLFGDNVQHGLYEQVVQLNAQIATASSLIGMRGGLSPSLSGGAVGAQSQGLAELQLQLARTQAMIDAQSNAENQYAASVNKANSAVFGALHAQESQTSSISGAAAAYTDLNSGLQKQIDAEKLFAPVAANHGVLVNGIYYSQKAVNQALTEASGDYNAAAGILRGHQDALESDALALNRAQFEQTNLSDAMSNAMSTYKLSSSQLDLYASAAGITADEVASGVVGIDAFTDAIGRVKATVDSGNTALTGYVGAVAQFNQSNKTAADTAALIGQTLKAYNGDALSYAGSLAGTTQAIDTLTGAFAQQQQQLAQQSAAQNKAARAQDSANARVVAAQARVDQVRGNSKHTAAQLAAAEASLTSAQNAAANASTAAGKQSALSYSDTERAALTFTKTTHGLTAAINTQAKGAPDLISQLQGIQDAAMNAAGAMYQHEVSTKGAKQAADDAYNIYVSKTQGALIDQASKLGLTTDQAKALAKQYFGMPSDVKTKIEALGTDKVTQILGGILEDLDKLSGGHHFDLYANAAQVFTVFDQIRSRYGDLVAYTSEGIKIGGGAFGVQAHATGGPVIGAGSGTSDSILSFLSNGEYVVNAHASAQYRALLDMMNYGGSPASTPSVASPAVSRPTVVNITQNFTPTASERASVVGPDALRRATEGLRV